MEGPSQLSLLSETTFACPSPLGLPVTSPTLDLSVTWDSVAHTLFIYRPPGQPVSKIHQHARPAGSAAPPEPQAVAWRPDGQFLAVGWSDGYVRIMGLENNKAAHHIRLSNRGLPSASESSSSSPSRLTITHISWVRNLVGRASTSDSVSAEPAWRKVLVDEMNAHLGSKSSSAPLIDLPNELALLEVDSSLPKLSPLPSSSAGSGEDALLFTLRTGIDFLFQPLPQDNEQIDVMVVGTEDGRVHLSVFDSFVVGDFDLVQQGSEPVRLVHHASHADVTTHCLFIASGPLLGSLATPTAAGPSAVYLVPMDLAFISSSPVNLSLLAFKLTTLQKLLRYLHQAHLHMLVELKNAHETPARFLRGIRETLATASEGPRDIVQALFHAVVTGHAHEPLREWLVDTLAERGHKRWDKAVTSALENLRSLTHEILIPALDRTAIILSRLRGLAQFHDTREDLGFSAAQVRRVLDTVAGLSLVAHRILLLTMDELGLFTAFSGWLRLQIDRCTSAAAAAATSSAADTDDLLDREAAVDVPKVLAYIERYLSPESPLSVFLIAEAASADAEAEAAALIEAAEASSLIDLISRQLRRQEEGQSYAVALPRLGFLLGLLSRGADAVFRGVSLAQQRGVHFRDASVLSTGCIVSMFDAVMSSVRRGGNADTAVYSALASEENLSEVWVFRTVMRIVKSISTTVTTQMRPLRVRDGRVVQFSFISEAALLILCKLHEEASPAYLVSLNVQSDSMDYADWALGRSAPSALILPVPTPVGKQTAEPRAPGVVFELPDAVAGLAGNAVRMEARGASEVRGHVPARVGLLAARRTMWSMLAIPESQDKRQSFNDLMK